MNEPLIRVGITHGDINGIGYEVIIKTLLDPRINETCTPIVYGSSKAAAFHRKNINVENFSFNLIRNAGEANAKRANLINCTDENIKVEPGQLTKEAGQAALNALQLAVRDLKAGNIDVLVTAPINKANIHSEQFNFPGHTEFLESQFPGSKALMLMVSDVMKVGVVTGHIPLSEVADKCRKDAILEKLRILNKTMASDFARHHPRIAVLGLNPHAGDKGLLGKNEENEIIPAIKAAREEHITAIGPFPADGFFGSGLFRKYDAVLAMYHDQGLTPFKALSYDSGVNYTAGLPFVRTSPAHGTAFDLVGKNLASEDSFRQSVFFAIDIFKNRMQYKELAQSPLVTGGHENA